MTGEPQPTRIMGILNVTPDSFSDGGHYTARATLRHRIAQLLAEGADILDVGGESTRPFAQPVGAEEELARVLPAIAMIRDMSEIPISVDTTKALVAREALAAGATMINDISALNADPAMVEMARSYAGPLIIMHMQGQPATMQLAPHYGDVVAEIVGFFRDRLTWLTEQGIGRERLILDPGIGFGKTLDHNLAILRAIAAFKELGRPLLLGHSRKSFLGKLLDLEVGQRDCATAMISTVCALRGVDILRVHHVALTKQALRLASVL